MITCGRFCFEIYRTIIFKIVLSLSKLFSCTDRYPSLFTLFFVNFQDDTLDGIQWQSKSLPALSGSGTAISTCTGAISCQRKSTYLYFKQTYTTYGYEVIVVKHMHVESRVSCLQSHFSQSKHVSFFL